MAVVASVCGMALIVVVLLEGFETIILPRRVTRRFRLTRLFYRHTWLPWAKLVTFVVPPGRQETWLSFFGPSSILILLGIWAGMMIAGYALLQWAIGSALVTQDGRAGFLIDLYLSGTTFFTLGLGDVEFVKKSSIETFCPLSRIEGVGFIGRKSIFSQTRGPQERPGAFSRGDRVGDGVRLSRARDRLPPGPQPVLLPPGDEYLPPRRSGRFSSYGLGNVPPPRPRAGGIPGTPYLFLLRLRLAATFGGSHKSSQKALNPIQKRGLAQRPSRPLVLTPQFFFLRFQGLQQVFPPVLDPL